MKAGGWIAWSVSMLAIAAIGVGGGLWWGGTHPASEPTPSPTVTQSSTPTPTPQSQTVAWTDLQRGDCLAAFSSAWDVTYQTIDCEQPHQAQVIAAAALPYLASFPGVDRLDAMVAKLCAKSALVDRSPLVGVARVGIHRNYPPTEQAWNEHPYYQCFVVQVGDAPLVHSVVPTPAT